MLLSCKLPLEREYLSVTNVRDYINSYSSPSNVTAGYIRGPPEHRPQQTTPVHNRPHGKKKHQHTQIPDLTYVYRWYLI